MGADMELVRLFNMELSSIYEGKPPVSKAKMATITRYAVKALKYYKHIVHSVEKFIHKCHNEYKLPALYVLDSIIRQSRHQFGPEKDLFGPRFEKNIKFLFQHIYQCPSEDKPKVVRVLNLWQKNGIYSPDVISPLIDMASQSQKSLQSAISKQKKMKAAANVQEDDAFDFVSGFEVNEERPSSSKKKRKGISMSQDDEIKVLKAQLEQQKKQQELLQQQLQMQMMQTKQQSLQMQIQQQDQLRSKMQEQATNSGPNPIEQPNLNILNQIQDLQKQLEKDKVELASLAVNNEKDPNHASNNNSHPIENQTQFLENIQQLIQNAKGLVPSKDPRSSDDRQGFDYKDQEQDRMVQQQRRSPNNQQRFRDDPYIKNGPPPTKKPLLNWEEERRPSYDQDDAMQIDDDDYEPSFQQPSHQEDPRKQQQQSQLKPEEVSEEQFKQQKEKEKKLRDKKLLPSPRNGCVTIASVTVWVGRLPKYFSKDALLNHFNEYADVKNVDMIESRGCAFVTMATRFDADSALRYMKHKRIDGADVKLNWGKTKALFDYSQYWEEKSGCAFVPWDQVNLPKLVSLVDTYLIDEDTLPPGMNLPSEKDEPSTPSKDEPQQVIPVAGVPPFIPGFPPGFFPPAGLLPGMPPAGLSGRLPFPGMLPPNILQLQNLQRQSIQGLVGGERPQLQGLGERPPLQPGLQQGMGERPPLQPGLQQGMGERPPLQGMPRPPIQGLGERPPFQNMAERPPFQNMGERPPFQQNIGERPLLQQNNMGERPPLQGLGQRPPFQNMGDRQSLLQSLGQQPRPGFGEHPQRPGFDENRPRPGQPMGGPPQRPSFTPAFGGDSFQNVRPRQEGPISPGLNNIRPPVSFGERPPVQRHLFGGNLLFNGLNQRPQIQNLLSQNQRFNGPPENRFTNIRPVAPEESQISPNAQDAGQRPPWLQNRDQVGNMGNQPSRNEETVEKNVQNQRNLTNLPTAAFLLNLVNQHKEQQASTDNQTQPGDEESQPPPQRERERSPTRDRSPVRDDRDRERGDRRRERSRERRDSDRDHRGRRDRSSERSSRSRRDDRGRERDYRGSDRERGSDRDRDERGRGSDRDERSRRSDRDRSGDRRRERSSERKSDRDRYERRGRDEDRYRSRDRRERSRERGRDRDRSQEESRERNEDELSASRSESAKKQDEVTSGDTVVATDQANSASTGDRPTKTAEDLYDPMEALDSPATTAQKESAPQETAQLETAQQETTQQEPSQTEETESEANQRETEPMKPDQDEKIMQESAQNETTGQETAQNETSEQETDQKETAEPEMEHEKPIDPQLEETKETMETERSESPIFPLVKEDDAIFPDAADEEDAADESMEGESETSQQANEPENQEQESKPDDPEQSASIEERTEENVEVFSTNTNENRQAEEVEVDTEPSEVSDEVTASEDTRARVEGE
ncbi:SR-related and CTD-associated factor 4-like isoform X1 [Clytia hemisphaerica]|uniref:Uncharacterized protein n=1 Tax=Clytia hemisphaerica TaxID=252671 RepID=A0A7M5VAP4_9CNID